MCGTLGHLSDKTGTTQWGEKEQNQPGWCDANKSRTVKTTLNPKHLHIPRRQHSERQVRDIAPIVGFYDPEYSSNQQNVSHLIYAGCVTSNIRIKHLYTDVINMHSYIHIHLVNPRVFLNVSWLESENIFSSSSSSSLSSAKCKSSYSSSPVSPSHIAPGNSHWGII